MCVEIILQQQNGKLTSFFLSLLQLVELMSSAIRDLTEGEFIGPRDKQNNPMPSPPGIQKKTISIFPEKKLIV